MEKTKKFYSQKAIAFATYFGGPLAAGYLVKKNYETLGESDKGKKALLIGILSTLLLFACIFSIPEEIIDKIPNALIPTVYCGFIYLIVAKVQGNELDEHEENGGEFYSGWRATGIGAIVMLILGVFIGSVAFIAGDFSKTEADFDLVTYEREIAKFIENENNALQVFNLIETAKPEYLIKEFGKGVVLWEENKEIVNNIDTIQKLPQELLEQNIKLVKYCDLRIQHSEMFIKAISEDTEKYISNIDRIGTEIEEILEELN